MALLELFIGGENAAVTTYAHVPAAAAAAAALGNGDFPLNDSVATIETVVNGTYYALVAAVATARAHPFTTTVRLMMPLDDGHGGGGFDGAAAAQYRMDASVSVVDAVLRELHDRPGTLQRDDGLPYDFGALLTPAGLTYVQQPATLERLWRMHADTFKPAPFEGGWTRAADGRTRLDVEVTAPSVTVVVVPPARSSVE